MFKDNETVVDCVMDSNDLEEKEELLFILKIVL